jgi:outer membrane protein insertion porin family
MRLLAHRELPSDPAGDGRLNLAGRWLTAASLLFLISAVSAQAQTQTPAAPPPIRIRDIRVEGAQSSSPSAIIAYSGLRIGDMITQNGDLISRAIKNLFERRLFSDVKIYAENQNAEGVTLVIVVKEYPRIGSLTYVGNDELSEKDLNDLVTIKSGEIASPYELDRSREKIKQKYADEGYLFTTVTVTQSPSADSGRSDVTFAINEGPEVRIGSVDFIGNKAFDDGDLKGAMEDVKEKSWWQIWRSSKFDRSKLKKDEDRVVDFYRSRGFIDAEVLGDSIAVNPTTGKADIQITVNEGNQVYLRSVTITGNTVYPTGNLLNRLNAETGKPYDQVAFNTNLKGNADESISTLYLDNGYLSFNAEAIETRVTPDSVDVAIRVTEGPQASIRYVSIAGNTKTMDKVIRRELFTHPGDTFSKAAVIRSLRNLANLNYFNPERLQPEVTPVDNTTVDITYDVEERPSDSFNASLGLSSLGLTVSLGLSFNNFAISEPFTGGGGQILNFTWEYGGYLSTFSLGLTEPWLFDTPTTLGADIFYQTQDLTSISGGGYSLRRAGGSLTLGRRLRWPDDYFRADLALRAVRNDITGDQSQSSYYRNGSEISATLTFSRSSIDNPIFPTVGSRFSFANTLAGLGDAKYSKHEIRYDFYSPLAQITEANSLVFYLNNEFGYLNDLGPIENIPPLTFYSMGGTAVTGYNTVPLRGYRDRSIGPTGLDDIPLGKAYAKVTTELRFGISLNPIPIFALAFAEAGNVWGSLREVDPFDLKRSAGLGLRIMIPGVGGLLGFDYGYGFDSDSFGSQPGWQFHFQFGR